MIGYEMGSSLAEVYIMAKTTAPVEDFKHEWNNDMVVNTATHFPREFSISQVSWATLIPWTRNSAFGQLQLEAFKNKQNSILYNLPNVVSNNLALGWNF